MSVILGSVVSSNNSSSSSSSMITYLLLLLSLMLASEVPVSARLLQQVASGRFDSSLNSQHFRNGTTALERISKDSKIRMHFNDGNSLRNRDGSVPLFNYTNFFNRLDEVNNDGFLPVTSKPSENLVDLNDPTEVRKRQVCADDKVELDYMHFKAISLENNLTRLAIDCNYTITKYQECKTEKLQLAKNLNYTVESWNACKRFCGGVE